MNRKLHDGIGIACLTVPATLTSTTDSSWVDLKGYDACELFVRVETITGAGSITPSIIVGDDTTTTGAVAAATGDTVGTFAAITTANDVAIHRIGYASSNAKRYAALRLTVSGSVSATVSVYAIVGSAASEPCANPTVAAAT